MEEPDGNVNRKEWVVNEEVLNQKEIHPQVLARFAKER
jgi:hypothetical protein